MNNSLVQIMKTINLEQMENVNGGGMEACLGGSIFATAIFVAAACTATVMTGGAAIVGIVGWYGSIGFSCLTQLILNYE